MPKYKKKKKKKKKMPPVPYFVRGKVGLSISTNIEYTKKKDIMHFLKTRTTCSDDLINVLHSVFREFSFSVDKVKEDEKRKGKGFKPKSSVNEKQKDEDEEDKKMGFDVISGWINKKKFFEICKKRFGFDEFLSKNLFRVVDTDNNAVIDFGEFVIGLAVFLGGKKEEKLGMVFKMIDVDKNNNLEFEEVVATLLEILKYSVGHVDEQMVANQVENLFYRSSLKRNGKLDYEMFRKKFKTSKILQRSYKFLLLED